MRLRVHPTGHRVRSSRVPVMRMRLRVHPTGHRVHATDSRVRSSREAVMRTRDRIHATGRTVYTSGDPVALVQRRAQALGRCDQRTVFRFSFLRGRNTTAPPCNPTMERFLAFAATAFEAVAVQRAAPRLAVEAVSGAVRVTPARDARTLGRDAFRRRGSA